MDDDDVAQFISVTGTDTETAQHYLSVRLYQSIVSLFSPLIISMSVAK